jgi:hypothetical protein
MKATAQRRSMGFAALLLPCLACAESQPAAQATVPARGSGHLSAVAHLDFKIVIPPILALQIPAGANASPGVRVLVSSNGRAVALVSSQSHATRERASVLTLLPGRDVAAQANCPAAALANPAGVTCTVSMP